MPVGLRGRKDKESQEKEGVGVGNTTKSGNINDSREAALFRRGIKNILKKHFIGNDPASLSLSLKVMAQSKPYSARSRLKSISVFLTIAQEIVRRLNSDNDTRDTALRG